MKNSLLLLFFYLLFQKFSTWPVTRGQCPRTEWKPEFCIHGTPSAPLKETKKCLVSQKVWEEDKRRPELQCQKAQVLSMVPGRRHCLGRVGGVGCKQDHSRECGQKPCPARLLTWLFSSQWGGLSSQALGLAQLKFLSSQGWKLAPSTSVGAMSGSATVRWPGWPGAHLSSTCYKPGHDKPIEDFPLLGISNSVN